MSEELDKLGENWRNSDGTLKDGHPGMGGRPKGKTLKEYAREYYMLKTDEEKKAYIDKLEEKIPGFAWRMAEGNPANNTDITTGGKPIYLPPELLNKNDLSSQSTEQDSK